MRNQRFTARTVLAALLPLLGAFAPVLAQEHTWRGVERVVAVGDVHGDYGQLVKVLKAAGVVDDKLDWTGGKTHLVQTGDVLDRGPDSKKAMDLLMKLEEQAKKAGGAVHVLIGNHEEMVLRGDYRYLTDEEVESFGGQEGLKKAMGPEGAYGRWIRSHNAVIKINDVLFLHAGLSPKYNTRSLDELNKGVREGLGKGGMGRDSAGPLWYRGLAWGDDPEEAPGIDTVLKTHGVSRVVIGHTVSDKVLARSGGKIIRIDVGMCKAYGGPAQCLLIEKDKYYVVTADEPKAELKLTGE